MRVNCNLFRAVRMGYVKSMVRYCRANGWRYFWADSFINWWRRPLINWWRRPADLTGVMFRDDVTMRVVRRDDEDEGGDSWLCEEVLTDAEVEELYGLETTEPPEGLWPYSAGSIMKMKRRLAQQGGNSGGI